MYIYIHKFMISNTYRRRCAIKFSYVLFIYFEIIIFLTKKKNNASNELIDDLRLFENVVKFPNSIRITLNEIGVTS